MKFHSDPLPPHVYTDAAYLSACTREQACDWLEARAKDHPAIIDGKGGCEPDRDSKLVEYILFRRRDTLIDLALARFGRNSDILRRLFQRACKSVRVTVCRNPFFYVIENRYETCTKWGDDPLAWDIVLNGSDAELQALCEQPELDSQFYSDLIKGWSGHPDCKAPSEQQIVDERFQKILLYLAGNPRSGMTDGLFSDAWHRYRYVSDGYAEIEFSSYFWLVVGLAELVPAESRWADCLAKLYGKMAPYWFSHDDPETLLKRWRPISYFGSRPFDDLRLVLAKFLMPATLETMDHEDPMIRRAFYQTFDPLAENMTKLNWEAWCERDEFCFFDLLENKNVWQTYDLRSRLESLAKDRFDFTHYSVFSRHETNMRSVHPEFFVDEDISLDEIEPDSSDDILEMKETLQRLEYQISSEGQDNRYVTARLFVYATQLWAVLIIILLILGLIDLLNLSFPALF